MSRNAKIAGVAALAGIMLAVALAGLREPNEPPLDSILPALEQGEQQKRLTRELERCATLTMPDSGCEQAWAANRRRFFGKDADAPAPGENALLPAPYNSAGSDGGRANAALRPELPGEFVPADQAASTAP
ncbi:putative entry exclusion protein TrbK-alt [Sphingosinicella microcystinivorans]|uniref:putative entry exclusion protein TrbK-alt n=1 Tax=Sphingosinicella microcystinivorans TaxID=335406 RepID=UPI0022F3D07A|nr:putative entry exclusion protein TrbK-alt [Sphingosinicella microcystinivorans]WBX82920.1 putative entry exclusion protein TrbK-alt [Sphingosinicella microcystinivorans]